jgi:hypothetical protein
MKSVFGFEKKTKKNDGNRKWVSSYLNYWNTLPSPLYPLSLSLLSISQKRNEQKKKLLLYIYIYIYMNTLSADSLRVIVANLDMVSLGRFAQTRRFTSEMKKEDLQWRKLKLLEDSIPLFMAYERIRQWREKDLQKEDVNTGTHLHRVVLPSIETLRDDCSLQRLLCMTQKEKTAIARTILRHFQDKEKPIFPIGLSHNAFELLVSLDATFLRAAIRISRELQTNGDTENDSARLLSTMSHMHRHAHTLCYLTRDQKRHFLYATYMPTIMLEVCRLKDSVMDKSQMKKILIHTFKTLDRGPVAMYIRYHHTQHQVKTVAQVWESCIQCI